MFTFNLIDQMPWEKNEQPDFSTDSHDFYVEEYFTKKVRTHKDGSENRKTKDWYVAIAIEKATGTKTWVVSNGAEIIKDAKGLEAIEAIINMFRFVNREGT